MPTDLLLTEGWYLHQHDPDRPIADTLAAADGWLPAQVPGTVHEALLAAGQIPDPFYDCNEDQVQWVGEVDWVYRSTWTLTAEQAAAPASLCFEGLDTIATVWLNGIDLCTSSNMFLPISAPVTGRLREGPNTLVITFAAALRHGRALEAAAGRQPVWNGDSSRVYVRKAQYHYGWDWGPCLLTAGPWQPIRLAFGAVRLSDLAAPIDVAADLATATISVAACCSGPAQLLADLQVHIQLSTQGGAVVAEATLPAAAEIQQTLRLQQPELWWPAGHGAQPRYRLRVTVQDAQGRVQDTSELRLGIRRLQLLREPMTDETGSSFLFAVNNRPLFCGGANWIPADSFPSRVRDETYRALLTAAVDANMLMLRVWGGGIYEQEQFYELCDRLGLLVWQDFMFACGLYPASPDFLESVRQEATAQLRRLRHHPCIALWCGNNEDYLVAHFLGRYQPATPPADDPAFPARRIYEVLLPELCAQEDPTCLYWPGSPFTGADDFGGTAGDRHVWDVWHGAMQPYQRYGAYAGRFVSEFGMQAAPAAATLRPYLAPGQDWPQSRSMDYHNKASDGPRRLAVYLTENVRSTDQSLETYSYQTQLVQAEALDHAYRAWRRRWAGPGRYGVGGALVWQLNDCYPAVSWSLIDVALRPKAALYIVRRALAPLCVGLAADDSGVVGWACNSLSEPRSVTLVVRAYTLDGALTELIRRTEQLAPLGTTEFGVLAAPWPAGQVLAAQLVADGAILARATLWPAPLKYLPLGDPAITITRTPGQLVARASRPAKGVWLDAGDQVAWADNMFDLLPDDPQTIAAPGLAEQPLQITWLGRGSD